MGDCPPLFSSSRLSFARPRNLEQARKVKDLERVGEGLEICNFGIWRIKILPSRF